MKAHLTRSGTFLITRIVSFVLLPLFGPPCVSQTRQISEPGENPKPTGGVAVAFRLVGCDLPGGSVTVSLKSSPSNPMTTPLKFRSVSGTKDGRGITTAYGGFGGLWPGHYTVKVIFGNPSCSPGRWLFGPETDALVSRENPRPTVRFLYVSQERQTTLDMGLYIVLLNSVITCDSAPLVPCLQPFAHLNNHGKEHDGSRLLANGSWLQYTPYWEPSARTAQASFTIPEVRRDAVEAVGGTLGVFKYYVSDIDSLPFQQQTNAVEWNPQDYKIHLKYQFEDSGTELKGYYRSTATGLSDSGAPDVDLTGPLSVEALLGLVYNYWDGRISYGVESTQFHSNSIQAGGICDLGWDLCNYAIEYKAKIENAVKDGIASTLNQPSAQGFVADQMEATINNGSVPAPLDGAFVTEMTKQAGVLNVKWVAMHLYKPPPRQPLGNVLPHLIPCPSPKTCCEPGPEGGCLKTCISKPQVCP